jgi:hypothetical protein
VFAAGEYRPDSAPGRRLLAHELAHVLQQDAAAPVLRRAPDDPPKQGGAPRQGGPAGPGTPVTGFSELKVEPSLQPGPCACLVFVHNEERNARATAEAMHKHCAYNLAIVSPDKPGERDIVIGKGPMTKDPNELFPPAVAKECREDRAACEAFVKSNAAAPTLESTQTQFFLAIDECSSKFTLPVVALHNNAISDTAAYMKRKEKVADPFKELPRDIVKPAKPDPVKKMKDALQKKGFDLGPLTETRRKTNIYRWCASKDISRCHIGDPDHPDNVVWATNPEDFKDLKAQGANVVLQSAAATGGESETDLSTLFLTVARLIREDAGEKAAELLEEFDWWDLLLEEDESALDKAMEALFAGEEAARKVRFINIETPASPQAAGTTPGQHRAEQFGAVAAVLRAAGLFCCGDDPAAAETTIKAELEKWMDEAMEAVKKAKAKAKAKGKAAPKPK